MISGGFYLKARCIQNAEISEAPPHVREIWDWLLKEANFKDMEYMGTIIKRGSCFTSYQEIRDGLSWRIGYRIQRYSKSQCETAMKYLTKHGMITTAKTTRGLLVTICKYEKYQDVKNYESYSEHETKATRKPQPSDTISKNDKKGNNEKKKKEIKDKHEDFSFSLPDDIRPDVWDAFIEHRTKNGTKLTEYAKHLLVKKLESIGQDKNAVLNQSIEKGWAGLFPLKEEGGFNGTGNNGRAGAGQPGGQTQGAGYKSEYPVDVIGDDF